LAGLDMDTINKLLARPEQKRGPRQKKDVTEPREYKTWWGLRHVIREEGCDNPDCVDPRPKLNANGKPNVTAEIKGKWLCRYCFLDGYLSDSGE
jgi:hypothetical protein